MKKTLLAAAAVVALALMFGASAMQFCIRHARRCSALALLVPATHVPDRTWRETTPPSPFMQFVLNHGLVSYPTGGHVWLGHDDEVKRELLGFLRTSLAIVRTTTQGDPR